MKKLFLYLLVFEITLLATGGCSSDNSSDSKNTETNSDGNSDLGSDTIPDTDKNTDTDSSKGSDTDSSALNDSDTNSGNDSKTDSDTSSDTELQEPFKGLAGNPSCAIRHSLNLSWFYNWMMNEKSADSCGDDSGGQFVPMIWGHPKELSETWITDAVSGLANEGYPYVLGFNEPDGDKQANLTVAEALPLWPSFDNGAIAAASPAPAGNAAGKTWLEDFMSQVDLSQVDVVAFHWYGWNAGSCDADAKGLENHIKWAESLPGNKPLWITEFGCLNESAPDEQTVLNFYKGALEVFSRHPRLVRYAWYPWCTNCGLFNDDESLTELGKEFAAAPPFK
ncbi:MAG: hypothetical protein JXR91_02310 [Deltaproteobacteria bacterium]|nr:hypothetical protein [Deltaproteobacteria bacterium]